MPNAKSGRRRSENSKKLDYRQPALKAKPGFPKMPRDLSAQQKKLWKQFREAANESMPNVFTELDRYAVLMFVDAWRSYQDAAKTDDPKLIQLSFGMVLQIGQKLGLSPWDRSKIRLAVEEKKEKDAFEKLTEQLKKAKERQMKVVS